MPSMGWYKYVQPIDGIFYKWQQICLNTINYISDSPSSSIQGTVFISSVVNA